MLCATESLPLLNMKTCLHLRFSFQIEGIDMHTIAKIILRGITNIFKWGISSTHLWVKLTATDDSTFPLAAINATHDVICLFVSSVMKVVCLIVCMMACYCTVHLLSPYLSKIITKGTSFCFKSPNRATWICLAPGQLVFEVLFLLNSILVFVHD